MDDDLVCEHSENSSASATPKVRKKLDVTKEGSAKRHRWKNWGWKHSPAKSSSIEEEPVALLESHSSKSSTPNQSPKHKSKVSSNETISIGDDSTPFRRRKQQLNQQQKSEVSKTELRSSAGARLIQLIDKDEKLDEDGDEFHALLKLENGRPASIHIIQTLNHSDEF